MSAGWELVYDDPANTGDVNPSTMGNFQPINNNQFYHFIGESSGSNYNATIYLNDATKLGESQDSTTTGDGRFKYTGTVFTQGNTSIDIKKIKYYHNGE